jgi:shikimate kinase
MKSIVLMGMKHCGKTTLGKMLAPRLALPFIDLDHRIEEIARERWGGAEKIRDLYGRLGKEGFAILEAEALERTAEDLTRRRSPCVLALGGGTIENPGGLKFLAGLVRFFYLEEDEDVLFARISSGGVPPFLDPLSPRESFRKLYQNRAALYRDRADVILDLRNLTPLEGLEKLLAAVKGV